MFENFDLLLGPKIRLEPCTRGGIRKLGSRSSLLECPLEKHLPLATPVKSWFADRGWQVLPHQKETWEHISKGHSGLLVSPTGAGKTYGAFLGFLPRIPEGVKHLALLYITPLKALARDIEKNLQDAVANLRPDLSLAVRSGDTGSYARQRQKKKPPTILITTPESLALLLTYEDAEERFRHLKGIIVDEWHDLLGSKRGSLLELNLAHIRSLVPQAPIWGLSATLGNPEEAARTLCGPHRKTHIVKSPLRREIALKTQLPDDLTSLPWAGHLGLRLAPTIANKISLDKSTLIFTNTRSQAERWFEALSLLMPEWEESLALHHGSIDPKERERVESGVKNGSIRVIVATASLDLGVDFPAVDLVVQIGSPKQLARMIQRAGRSAHSPGGKSEIWFVPTHALELIEALAFKKALLDGRVESRSPLPKPLDVLVQHIVSRAIGGGITFDAMERNLKDTVSFAKVTESELSWAFNFVKNGGGTLASYPQYCKLVEKDGCYTVKDRMIALRHRQNIGTITSESSVVVKISRGRTLGTVEESFIAQIPRGSSFLFAGRWLELVSLRDMTAYVKPSAKKKNGAHPVWTGGSLPWSQELSRDLRAVLDSFAKDEKVPHSEELALLRPILETQKKLSVIPAKEQLLIESSESRDGLHIFVFPFMGKALHEGLGAIMSLRLSRFTPGTYTFSANDYGIEILTDKTFPVEHVDWRKMFASENIETDLLEALHLAESAKRQFRSIAQVAGLILQNIPGQSKSTRQLQVSSSILYDVFCKFDPENKLLIQAQEEALSSLLEGGRLSLVTAQLSTLEVKFKRIKILTPLAFPLYLERVSSRLSNENMGERIARMQGAWLKSLKSSGKSSKKSRGGEP